MNESQERLQESPRKILVISDNEVIANTIADVIQHTPEMQDVSFEFACSPNSVLEGATVSGQELHPLNVKTQLEDILKKNYSLILSAHCQQIFPKELVENVKCINIHPGLNPYNRGMFPHVFSLINGLPTGATLHEIDSKLDHGKIIDQEEVPASITDTSGTLYEKIIEAEKRLLAKHLGGITVGEYIASDPTSEGNMNTRKDFENLKEIRLDSVDSFANHLNLLRALSHGDRRNAYFIDPETGKRIWVKVELEEDDE